MPERLISDAHCDDRTVGLLTERAELLFLRLLLKACPLGRYYAEPAKVKTQLLANRPRLRVADVTAALDELVRSGLASYYADSDGTRYVFLPCAVQTKLKHAARSPFPAPRSGPPDAPGQELIPLAGAPPVFFAPLKGREEKFPPNPPPSGGQEEGSFSDGGAAAPQSPAPAAASADEEAGPAADTQADIGYRRQADIDRELFVTLAALEGSPLDKLTRTGKTSIERALAAIRRVERGLTSLDLERAAARWKVVFPTATLTAAGLAKHWAKLQGEGPALAKKAAPLVPDEPDGWRDWINENTPDAPYARGGEKEGTPWHDLDAGYRRYLLEKLAKKNRPAA